MATNESEATKYKRVVDVISKPPSLRKDFEVTNLIPWFRKQSRLFASLKTEMVFDVIKNLSFISRVRDDVLIREGDRGDCMYITLKGKSSIYRMNEDIKQQQQQQQQSQQQQQNNAQNKNESIRLLLGDHLVTLGRDAVFGDVALMSDDCIRTASVIVDEPSDYIVVDRDLYDRSVKSVLKKEFEDKTNFIASCPFFKSWMPRYRKQLAMAMQKECMAYEAILTRQGDPVENIYYILSGEVKIVMDPTQHRLQYPKLLAKYPDSAGANGDVTTNGSSDNKSIDDASTSHNSGQQSARKRKQSARRQLSDVCLLGVNESVGDVEVLTELPSYMQTSICTQRCEILVLELKHFERLFVKRHARTVDTMKDHLVLQLQSRMTTRLEHTVPLLRCLLDVAIEAKAQRRLQSQARTQSVSLDRQRTVRSGGTGQSGKSVSELFETFVPSRGALIDIYGPGTVFYRIRQREASRLARLKKRGLSYNTPTTSISTTVVEQPAPVGGMQLLRMGRRLHEERRRKREEIQSANAESNVSSGAQNNDSDDIQTDSLTSDPALRNLEERMKDWLSSGPTNQDSPHTLPTVGGPRYQPRFAKLHRTQTDVDEVKLGAKVVLRAKQAAADDVPPPPEFDIDDDDPILSQGSAWV